jgi:HAD superfamily hydrolase (TIGR01509 family)
MAAPLAALIFDVDGTLAETEEAHRIAFNRAFADFGLPWAWDAVLYRELLAVGGGKERITAFARRFDPARLDGGFDDLLARLHRHKTALYTSGVAAGGVGLRPGIARLVAEARAAGLRLAVATTTSRANVLALLDGATGGAGHAWFEVLACGEDSAAKKPDPGVYLAALRALALPAAACLAIEDSRNGIRAATAAGIPVVATRSIYTPDDDVSGALAVFPDFAAVDLAQLRRLHQGD